MTVVRKSGKIKNRNSLIPKYIAWCRGLVTTHLFPPPSFFIAKSIMKLPKPELRISVFVSLSIRNKCNALFYNVL